MAKEDKLKALDAAIAQIEKQYGKGSVMKLGDNSANMNVETVPTGSLSLDIALGLGGLPQRRNVPLSLLSQVPAHHSPAGKYRDCQYQHLYFWHIQGQAHALHL